MNGAATVEGKPNPAFEGLRKGMAQSGCVEGSDVAHEARFPYSQLERLPGFATEHKILKGPRPADTPFEVVSRRVLAINQRTARTLGITVLAALLKGADRVID
ncbi:ABC transporter substrate binding protein [Noviherbaspirillum humi]|nr:ABC transporter substrate binding protein [Noviherbaspirillum humi]